MIVVIKLKDGSTLIGEEVRKTPVQIHLKDPIKLKEHVVDVDGYLNVSLIPALYMPLAKKPTVIIDQQDIMVYDETDEFGAFFYESCVTVLVKNELIRRQKIINSYSQILDDINKDFENTANDLEEDSNQYEDDYEEFAAEESNKPTLH